MNLTPYQSQFYAWQLTRRTAGTSVEDLAATLVDSQVDINPHQVEAALFACKNPLSKGVILADEVGLGKTIEAGLVILQRWAERRKRILIIVPANLRKQWYQELLDKFGLQALILEAKKYKECKTNNPQPFLYDDGPIICSYQFASKKAEDLAAIQWDLVVMDEAHRLRNAYKPNNVMGKNLKAALDHNVTSKVLLTATPLQNSLLELYGLVSIIDDQVFGDLNSFRAQFFNTAKAQELLNLRSRLASICKRTLREQVLPYVNYTKRSLILQEFTPSAEEKQLNELVGEYLSRPYLQALPQGQRQLISLVLWKLLASSSHAIAGALTKMSTRLQGQLAHSTVSSNFTDEMLDDYDGREVLLDETDTDAETATPNFTLSQQEYDAVASELKELEEFRRLASGIRDNGKGKELLTALATGFAKMQELQAEQKAIIFTESKRTQAYLQELLEKSPYAGRVVLFNGNNTDARSNAIYKAWAKRHAGTDRISGSKSADTRAALVDYFKEEGKIMIATEAGAEGINLQFCSLVINYDLPWNPQRIEQRIGRCHRYGQKFDVVVVNFVNMGNIADRRVYELLRDKFQLFEGVFGASDEVLGAIGSGVDFERRIADIYEKKFRNAETIEAGFAKLQNELSSEINQNMLNAKQILAEHFDEKVQERLRFAQQHSKEFRDKYSDMLLQLTRFELAQHAVFDQGGFALQSLPSRELEHIALGRYELPHENVQAHSYRLTHPLAQWLLNQAKQRELGAATLRFDYAAFIQAGGKQRFALKERIGQRGWLCAKLISITSLEREIEHIVVAACNEAGELLAEDDPMVLLNFPAEILAKEAPPPAHILQQDAQARLQSVLDELNGSNLAFFDQEVEKLDAWADDQKLALEQGIKDIDRQIKEIRRTASTANTLDQKLHWQKQQREMETRRNKLRRELFDHQDQIEEKRNGLITDLEKQLQQQLTEETLFTIAWELV